MNKMQQIIKEYSDAKDNANPFNIGVIGHYYPSGEILGHIDKFKNSEYSPEKEIIKK